MIQNHKTLVYIIITSLALFGLSIMASIWGHSIKFIITFALYFSSAWFLYSRKQLNISKLLMIAILLLPGIIILLPLHVFDFQHTKVSFLSSASYLISAFFGILVSRSRRVIQVLLVVMLILTNFWVYNTGYSYWLNYINFGTATGKYQADLPEFELWTEDGNRITHSDLKNKLVVLDFWNSHCGICLKKFPVLEEKFLKYKNDTTIRIFAVYIPLRDDDTKKDIARLRLRGFTFPILAAKSSLIMKSFNFTVVPIVIIFDRSGQIIFRGDIENIDKFILESLK